MTDFVLPATCLYYLKLKGASRPHLLVTSCNMAARLLLVATALLCTLLATENVAVKQLKHPAFTGSEEQSLKVLYWSVSI